MPRESKKNWTNRFVDEVKDAEPELRDFGWTDDQLTTRRWLYPLVRLLLEGHATYPKRLEEMMPYYSYDRGNMALSTSALFQAMDVFNDERPVERWNEAMSLLTDTMFVQGYLFQKYNPEELLFIIKYADSAYWDGGAISAATTNLKYGIDTFIKESQVVRAPMDRIRCENKLIYGDDELVE